MAKKAAPNTVEVAKATSADPAACKLCAYSRDTPQGLMCGVRLPPWVKRSDRPVDNVVRPNDSCDLYKQGF